MPTGPTKAIQAAQAAINAHQKSLLLEDGNGPATDLRHLIHSLLDWSDAMNVDFDATVSEVREDIAIHGLTR
ncbi:hypothetical protein [Aquibium microcysteis]|uniref:hypothetical protein n=1 Tax=Aquibium microcysteis TaxID=675281 RepID=UPI00165D1F16|nr:hypothetical protein [Aquibium microcysteis]